MSIVIARPASKPKPVNIDANKVPDGFFTAHQDGGKRALWLKVDGRITLIQGEQGVLVPEPYSIGLGFSNYQPVDVEITYTPCK